MSVQVHLYDTNCENLNLGEIKDYLAEKLPKLKVDIRGEFLNYHINGEDLSDIASDLASIRVLRPDSPFRKNEPLHGEIEYEKRVLAGSPGGGVLYDGLELTLISRNLLREKECNIGNMHIAFTNRLIGTFDDDLRYHARVIVCSVPSIISTTGIVEAPAKPREYYIQKELYSADAYTLAEIKKKFAGEFIDYDDHRLTEVAKGYVMQALVYMLTGEAFCKSKKCRLFNAHWQREMIEAQFSANEFCRHHTEVLQNLNNKI